MKNVQPCLRCASFARRCRCRRPGDRSSSLSARRPDRHLRTRRSCSTSAGLVKPNIMLLMDASGSMGRTHMPDEIETTTGPTSVGYKSSQCNVLYYNPTQTVHRCRSATTARSFPTPTFTAAPYAGFGAYYAAPDLSTSPNLSTSSSPTTTSTLEIVAPFPRHAPARLLLCLHRAADAQLQRRALHAHRHAVRPSRPPGGGTWTTRYSTPARPNSENFAIWYSYYRTRMSLIKSAASLAFTPLTDTYRVGFITVEPKDTPTDRGDQPDPLPADQRFQHRPEEPLVQQAVLADAAGRVACARRPGARRPLLRRQAGRHQHRHARRSTIRSSTPASRTSPS